MKRLLLFALLLLPLPAKATVHYIGLAGGTISQCDGLTNVPLAGSSGGHCQLIHPYWLLNQSTFAWNTSAGDTIQFTDTGPYYFGQTLNGLGQSWPFCVGQETQCRPPSPPNNTHIWGPGVGACHDTGHTKVTNAAQIIGINDVFFAFGLLSTVGVDMQCLDISGAETCTQVGSGFSNVISTQQTGTVATYQFVYNNGTPLVLNESVTVQSTTNDGGHFNVTKQVITGGTGLGDGNIASISSYAISGSTATFQNNSQLQNLTAGEIFQLSGFTGGSTFLNGQIITVLATGLTSSQFEATVTGSGSATATGQIHTTGTFTLTLSSATVANQAESGGSFFGGSCGGAGVSNNLQNGILFNFGAGSQGPDSLTMADISIHGVSHNAIWGSKINSSTGSTTSLSDIYLAGSGESDWDTDSGSCGESCESQGTINLNNIHAKWSGFVEVIPNGGTIGGNGYNYGVDQAFNGNGDCLVMIASGGTWNWSNSSADHCAQDAWDLLHLADDPSSGIVVNETNLFGQFAEGQTIKGGGKTINATNVVGTGSCNWPFDLSFPGNPPGWNALLGLTCRASDGMAFSIIDGYTLNLSNIDNITMQSTAWDFSPPFVGVDCTTTCATNLTNAVTMGFTGNPNNPGTLPGHIFIGSTVNPFTFGSLSHTRWWQMKTGTVPSEPNTTATTYGDPVFTAESSINAMNIVPASGSPLIGAGVTHSGIPSADIFGVTYSSPPPIGAAMQAGTPTVATPTFSPIAGPYGPAQSVTISTSTGGASLIYTTDGSTPTVTALSCTITHGTLYTGTVTVSTSQTLNAIGCLASSNASSVGTAAYVINGAVANPTCTPAAGSFTSAQSITCSSSTGGSTTTCTTNGSTPTHGSPACTSISVATSLTLKALSFETGWSDSSVISNVYTITLPPPNATVFGTIKMMGTVHIP